MSVFLVCSLLLRAQFQAPIKEEKKKKPTITATPLKQTIDVEIS
jgi:hypothetical protein